MSLNVMSLLPQQNESPMSKGAPGDSDPMVGKVASPVRTKLLDGTPFNLAEHKGKVVVLDFGPHGADLVCVPYQN